MITPEFYNGWQIIFINEDHRKPDDFYCIIVKGLESPGVGYCTRADSGSMIETAKLMIDQKEKV